MTDRGSLAVAAEWVEADPRRGRWFFAGIAALVHAGALLFWLRGGSGLDHAQAERIAVLGIWAAGAVPIARLAAGDVPERARPMWLLLDGVVATALVLVVRDVGNPLVFQRAMIPIAVAFMVGERRRGWSMAGAFGAVLVTAALALPATGTWAEEDTGLWVFWAAIPLVLCSGPFMLIADGRTEFADLRARRRDRARLQAEARASHRAEATQQAELRAHGRLHNRETGWLVDVAGTLAEHIDRTRDPALRRRLAELHAEAEAAEHAARALLDELGGTDA
ncbi:MAG: hypothetical protein U0237_19725 [Thermoleophilia bacterium]